MNRCTPWLPMAPHGSWPLCIHSSNATKLFSFFSSCISNATCHIIWFTVERDTMRRLPCMLQCAHSLSKFFFLIFPPNPRSLSQSACLPYLGPFLDSFQTLWAYSLASKRGHWFLGFSQITQAWMSKCHSVCFWSVLWPFFLSLYLLYRRCNRILTNSCR